MAVSWKKLVMGTLGLSAFGTLAYARLIEPAWVHVRYIRVPLVGLDPAFHDYRVVQIADIHMGSWMNRARLQSTVDLINDLRPDAIAITGDFVDRKAIFNADDLIEPLSALHPLDVKVGVLGNHDYRFNANAIRRVLNASGVIELNNRVHTLRRGDAQLHIAGVDSLTLRQDCLDAVLDALPAEGAALLLAHEPDFADVSAPTERFGLQISGHTHGGQIHLPLIGIPVRPDHGQRYPSGQYQVGKMMQYTNRGLGMIRPYLRLGARPEITVFMLEAVS